MSTTRCATCEDELEGDEHDVCRECTNEAAGRCRWCGERQPAAGSDLCKQCTADAQAAMDAGSF